MDDLIERLKSAKGSDSELDARIAVKFGIIKENIKNGQFSYWIRDENSHENWRLMLSGDVKPNQEPILSIVGLLSVPLLTSYLDAGIALAETVLPGWDFEITHDDGISRASLWRRDRSAGAGRPIYAEGPTLPRAFLIALLRAYAAQEKHHD